MKTVLLVEDNADTCKTLQIGLRLHFKIISAGSLAKALDQLKSQEIDAILLDLNLPDSSGEKTLIKVRDARPDLPIIVYSGYEDQLLSAISAGAQDIIKKWSTDFEAIHWSIKCAIERHKVRGEFKPLKDLVSEAEKIVEDLKNLPKK